MGHEVLSHFGDSNTTEPGWRKTQLAIANAYLSAQCSNAPQGHSIRQQSGINGREELAVVWAQEHFGAETKQFINRCNQALRSLDDAVLWSQLRRFGSSPDARKTNGSRPVSCTCAGSNDNCRRCTGKGYLERQSVQPSPGEGSRFSERQAEKKTRAAGNPPSKTQLQTRSAIQPAPARPSSAQSSGAYGRRTTAYIEMVIARGLEAYLIVNRRFQCRYCEAPFEARVEVIQHLTVCGAFPERFVAEHMRANRSFHEGSVTNREHQAPKERSNRYVSCKLCRTNVKEANLVKHMAENCPQRKRHVSNRTNEFRLTEDMSNKELHSTKAVAEFSDRLDATRLYAHNYLENGRFGSHPGHDAFDDESGPG